MSDEVKEKVETRGRPKLPYKTVRVRIPQPLLADVLNKVEEFKRGQKNGE